MTFSSALLDRGAAAVRAFDGADLASLPHAELRALGEAAAQVVRAAQAIATQAFGEVSRRSSEIPGGAGFARREGFRTPEQLVADALGTSRGEAGRLVGVGRMLAEAEVRAGQEPTAPPELPPLASAVAAGTVTVAQADVIRRCLEDCAEPDPDLERRLVAKAPRLTLDELARVCRREWALRNRQLLRERELRQRAARSLVISQADDGMTILTARLDVRSAAPIRAWFDAQVKAALQAKREHPEDDRSAPQIRVDALAMLALHGLGCDASSSGVKTTVVVRVDAAELEAELGVGECDQVPGPISVSELRAMAVDARILPVVMGGPTVPLELGRARRLFTEEQKLALVERDGGCAWCHAPPSWCHGHHITWWRRDGGRTDLRNGVLLCTACHHRVHDQGWTIEVKDGQVWFTLPRSIDPTGTPRLGGKAHLALQEVA